MKRPLQLRLPMFKIKPMVIICLLGINCIGLKGGKIPPAVLETRGAGDAVLSIDFRYRLQSIKFLGDDSQMMAPYRNSTYLNMLLNQIHDSGLAYRLSLLQENPKTKKSEKVQLPFREDLAKKNLPEFSIEIELTQIEHGNGLDVLWGLSSYCTLTIIPWRQKETFVLSLGVRDASGSVVLEKIYEDEAIAWTQIALLPIAGAMWPWKVEDEVLGNLYATAIQDIGSFIAKMRTSQKANRRWPIGPD